MNEAVEARLRSLNVLIVSHLSSTGPAHELERYLAPLARRLVFIGHPLRAAEERRSFVHIRLPDGGVRGRRSVPAWLGSEAASTLIHVCLTLWWGWREPKTDLYIGLGGVNAFCGLLLRAAGRADKVVFWTIDYVPRRFGNRLLDWIYRRIDAYCAVRCDRVWNLGSRMVEAREKFGNVSPAVRANQITVPMGTDPDVEQPALPEIERFTIAFMGNLLRVDQGVETLLEALPRVLEAIPEARLLIVGDGPHRASLEALRERLGLADRVQFTGAIEDHRELLERLARCAVGVAPYGDDPDSLTWVTDPGKPKAYLSAGLPVVITPVPEIAAEFRSRGAGVVSGHSSAELADAIVRLLAAPDYERYRERSQAMAQDYAWPRLFSAALSEMP